MLKFASVAFSKVLLVFSICLALSANSLEIALSFDDAPLADGPLFTGIERANKLVTVLKAKNVQEVAFFCSNLIDFNKEKQARLRRYNDAGHIIANHTASHINFHSPTTNTNKFIADIEDADKKLSSFPNYKRWFRYPYLRQKQLSLSHNNDRDVEIYLENEKYKHGYVTVETYDWHLNSLLKKDIENGINPDREKLKKVYISILWDGIEFYDKLAKEVLGRSPKHIILLHENDLNALFIGDLIDYIYSKGGKIIPISEAYTDAIAAHDLDLIPYSQRRVRAIARHKNYKGSLISRYEDTTNIDTLYQNTLLN